MIECECCSSKVEETDGEKVYDIGFVCNTCLDKADDKTGYCSMHCQLFGQCDHSC